MPFTNSSLIEDARKQKQLQQRSVLSDMLSLKTNNNPIEEEELNMISPISPEFDSLTGLPSPVVTESSTPHSGSPSIDSLSSLNSPRIPISPKKKNYGSLISRPTQTISNYNNHHRIVSEFDSSLTNIISPPTRNFSSPLNKIQLHQGVAILEREQQNIINNNNNNSLKEEEIYEGFDSNQNKFSWKYLGDIGKGNFSTVVLGELIEPNKKNSILFQVAIKIINLPNNSDTKGRIESSLKREISILNTMNHPSIIKLLSLNISTERYLIITPYYKGGDLFELASKHRSEISGSLIRKIFAEVSSGICYLHQNNIVHRDIKLENILINYSKFDLFKIQDFKNTAIITITDFGLSREIDPENPLLSTRCGSEDYVPPELLIGLPYDGRESDSWALGVLLYSIMEGRLPFDPPPVLANTIRSRRQSKVSHRIARIDWSWYKFRTKTQDETWSEQDFTNAKYLVDNLLVRREKRLNTKQICESPYVADFLTDNYLHFLNN